ncbi:helix-turn-helix domain-containing protein [Prevotella brunnea]|uniref:Helix-turn-helix domain-containing protein n=1 Tax=Prevotella brunnea TaxID=2508867 RepID=A0A5C8GET5_9BACT|nr:response regulator transcription factor [Prevotella brunnea]MDR0187151.1 helix-turn-helix domain-containing protein [Prevotella brunnea]TXJ60427.1 helix-turn-helix domain-containing protein [Prevotella brunnea]
MIQALITITPMLVCMFWVVMLLLELHEHGNRAAHGELLLWAITATLLYSGHCVFFNYEYQVLPFVDSMYITCNLAIFPLYLRYITKLTQGRVSTRLNALVLFPPLVFGITALIIYLLMTPEEIAHFFDIHLYHNQFDELTPLSYLQTILHQARKVLFAISVVLTAWLGFRKIKSYNRLVDSIYASTDDKRLRGITPILLLLLVTGVISIVANAIGRCTFTGQTLTLFIPSTVFSILLFAIGYFGYRQQFSFVDIDKEEEQSGECSCVGNFSTEQLKYVVIDEQLFLQPNLKVDDVARHMGTNRRYVQQLLNVEMGMSFNEYINRLRTDYAEQLFKNRKDLSVETVLGLSGYLSASTFYRNFKKYKGYTPRT